MGTVPSPPTFAAGEKPTAAKMNQIRDLFNFLTASPRVMSYQNASTTTFGTSGTYGLVGFDADVFDVVMAGDAESHNVTTNNSRFVCQTAGKYRIGGQLTFVTNATGIRAIQIRLNSAGSPTGGTQLDAASGPAMSGFATIVSATPFEYPLNVGDYLEMFGQQTSGGSLASQAGLQASFMWMEWVAT